MPERPLRVLLTVLPVKSHFWKHLPLMKELARRGHEVAVASTPPFCPTIAERGLRTFPAGADVVMAGWNQRLPELAAEVVGAPNATIRRQIFTSKLVVKTFGASMLPDLIKTCQEWRPDVVLVDSTCFAGHLASEAIDAPHVTLHNSGYRTYVPAPERDPFLLALEELSALAGLPGVSSLEAAARYLEIVFFPLSFHVDVQPPPTCHAFSWVSSATDEPLPNWVLEKRRQGATMAYASLGHLHGRYASRLYPEITRAFDGLDAELILSTGGCVKAADVQPVPSNVRVVDFINQPRALDLCSVAISHGGAGTLGELMDSGVPFLAMPFGTDQPANARRAAAMGMAKILEPDQADSEKIRAAVNELLADPSYVESARRMSAALKALPGLRVAAEVIERLAIDRRPVLSIPS